MKLIKKGIGCLAEQGIARGIKISDTALAKKFGNVSIFITETINSCQPFQGLAAVLYGRETNLLTYGGILKGKDLIAHGHGTKFPVIFEISFKVVSGRNGKQGKSRGLIFYL